MSKTGRISKRSKMTKKAAKERAQDLLMLFAANAFLSAYDNDEPQEVVDALKVQFSRMEKLFGYDKDSWMRGEDNEL